MKTPTQNEQVLAVLHDGRWHTSRQIHTQVFCVLHSRIAELRRRGYMIEHRGGGAGADAHEYRLVSPLNAPPAVTDRGVASLSCRDDGAGGALSGGRRPVGDLAASSTALNTDANPPSVPPGELEPTAGPAQLTLYDVLAAA